MTEWIARVELHKTVSEADYQTLHTAMDACGFRRYTIDAQQRKWKLPQATYWRVTQGNETIVSIRNDVEAAAVQTRRKYWYFISAYKDSEAAICSDRYFDDNDFKFSGRDPQTHYLDL